MKEITRVHLAKVAYDVELDAKRQLERYLEALGDQTDQEVMTDIESRMVELLAERGVMAGGVITTEDVSSIKTRLGAPEDFAETHDNKASAEGEPGEDEKRLYRDTDNAIVGGVLSGLSRYFSLDPVVVRLIFFLLVLITHGAAVVLYLVLWFIVPAARTAGQKLQMSGKPITAASIREFSTREFTNERLATIRRVASYGIGIMMIVMMAVALMVTVAFGLRFSTINEPSGLLSSIALTLSGLLATLFCGLMAHTFLRQRFTAQRGNELALIAVVGLVSFAVFVALNLSSMSGAVFDAPVRDTIPGLL